MKFGLTEHAIIQIAKVFAQHPAIERAVLYGSRAKGNYKNGSDIDLTLVGDALNTALLHTLINELDDLLLPWMIDLSIYAQIDNPDLRSHIERVGVVFYPMSTAING